MFVIEVSGRKKVEVEIKTVKPSDYRKITKKRYFFNWKSERKFEVYKLTIVESSDILGLMSFEKIPEEWRIHIRLISVSDKNKGKGKEYEQITGNLIAYAARVSIMEFAELACISLKPKSELVAHYIEKFGMKVTGLTLSIEMPEIMNLVNRYEK